MAYSQQDPNGARRAQIWAVGAMPATQLHHAAPPPRSGADITPAAGRRRRAARPQPNRSTATVSLPRKGSTRARGQEGPPSPAPPGPAPGASAGGGGGRRGRREPAGEELELRPGHLPGRRIRTGEGGGLGRRPAAAGGEEGEP
nr:homeobox protein engrailed-2-like [Aegilops tauschii subsp. strangulata]